MQVGTSQVQPETAPMRLRQAVDARSHRPYALGTQRIHYRVVPTLRGADVGIREENHVAGRVRSSEVARPGHSHPIRMQQLYFAHSLQKRGGAVRRAVVQDNEFPLALGQRVQEVSHRLP